MRKPILAFLLLTFGLVAVAIGQGTTSRVTGTVQDANGAAIAGAMVTLTNEATGVSFTTETSDSGTYAFDLVQVGKYTLTIEKQGFKKFISTANPVNVNQPATDQRYARNGRLDGDGDGPGRRRTSANKHFGKYRQHDRTAHAGEPADRRHARPKPARPVELSTGRRVWRQHRRRRERQRLARSRFQLHARRHRHQRVDRRWFKLHAASSES